MERSVFRGLAAFRAVAWAWIALATAVSPADLVREWLAVLLLLASLAFTLACWRWQARTDLLRSRRMVVLELALGAAMLALDGLVRPDGAVFESGQSIASVWPLAGVMSAALAFGAVGAAGAGVLLGSCRYLSTVLNGVTDYGDGRGVSLFSTGVLYAMAGFAVAYVYRLLTAAREEVAAAQAREEIARTLHDGVLQTLALVERRAGDPALAKLARDQERELRTYLFGDRVAGAGDLGAALRSVAGRFEERFGVRVDVHVADDLPGLPEPFATAIAGAVGEALTNAAKHGEAQRVVVFADVDDVSGGVFCSVKDDGRGFDPSRVAEGVGLSRSIRGRIEALGGQVTVASAPGSGAEVSLRVPPP